MRAMPSPTSMTVPTSATSMAASYEASCCRMIWLISSALICAIVPPYSLYPFVPLSLPKCLAAHQLLSQPRQLRFQASVVHLAADLGDKPAQDLRVLLDLEIHPLPGHLLQPLPQALLLLAVQSHRGRHLRLDAAQALVHQRFVGPDDALQRAQAVGGEQQPQEGDRQRAEADPAHDPLEGLELVAPEDAGVGQEPRQFPVAPQEVGDVPNLLAHRLEIARGGGHVRPRPGIPLGQRSGAHFSPPSSRTYCSASRFWSSPVMERPSRRSAAARERLTTSSRRLARARLTSVSMAARASSTSRRASSREAFRRRCRSAS